MTDLRTAGDFVWWVKRTISNIVLHEKSPQTIKDIYEDAQKKINASLKSVMGDLDPMTEKQIEVLQGYITRTIQRRMNIRPGKLDAKEDLDAQKADDKALKDCLLPEDDWRDMV